MDPVTDFLDALGATKEAAEDRSGLRKDEVTMWQTWKDNGKKQADLKPLLASIRPFIMHEANKWARQRDVPPAAIKAEFTNHAVKALETYDPTKAALNTYLSHQMRRAHRFVTTYQNAARIPETRIYKVQPLKNATVKLEESLGRPPTSLELADELQWSPKKVEMLQREDRASLPTSHFEADPLTYSPSQQNETLRLLRYELTPEENAVFEHIYGFSGKQKLSPGAIATKLNMSAPKVSRLKKSISEKYDKYSK